MLEKHEVAFRMLCSSLVMRQSCSVVSSAAPAQRRRDLALRLGTEAWH